ncbi:hypothetical protein [uncultured Tateyamaria sp.]|uniref:hypothetical protein n=1 Tax=uncultured Tateyamaria sp. TaxID=455651 RepID=UPI0026253EED|nr:hypothetical protein [uncultured Tateyamaria sp.]
MLLKSIHDAAWNHEAWALETGRNWPRISALPIGSLAVWPAIAIAAYLNVHSVLTWAESGGWLDIFLLISKLLVSFSFIGWLFIVAVPRTIVSLLYIIRLTATGRSSGVDARIEFLGSSRRKNLI